MSRTYKDKPSKLIWGDYAQDYVYLENFRHIWRKTTKPKLRRSVNDEWAWYSATPSWWNRLFHTAPIRRNFRDFCTVSVGLPVDTLEDILEPSDSKKPHKYFY